jgi:hypothetical protein
LARNLFGTVDESATAIDIVADYVRHAANQLARQPGDELLTGDLRFPTPSHSISPPVSAERTAAS